MATLQDAIDIARPIINDINPAAYRWSDADLTQYGNDALDAICEVMPQLFYKLAEITCITDTPNQQFSVADNKKFIGLLNVKGGNVINKTTVEMLDAFKQGWRSAASATATDWAPADDDPNRFYIYPPAPVSQVVVGKYVSIPQEYAISDTHILDNTYTPPIAEYIISRALDRQTDGGDPQLADKHLARFYAMLGTTKPNIIPPKQ